MQGSVVNHGGDDGGVVFLLPLCCSINTETHQGTNWEILFGLRRCGKALIVEGTTILTSVADVSVIMVVIEVVFEPVVVVICQFDVI